MRVTKQPSKKVLFDAIDLIESFVHFQDHDIAKQLRKHTGQLNELPTTSSSREKQSAIPSFFKTCVTEQDFLKKGAPTSICHFFRPSVRPSVRPIVRRAPYLRNRRSSDHNFWYTCVK